MKTKRSQTDMIVTVLLILIALAAIAGVAYFITKNVKGNVTVADLNAQCLSLEYEITGLTSGTGLTVKRGTSGADVQVQGFIVSVDGGADSDLIPAVIAPGEESPVAYATTLTNNQKVELKPVLTQNDYVCPVKAEKIYYV